MDELKSGVKVSKEDQDVLNAIFNAVESGEYASSAEVLREALSDWKLNREVRLRRETGGCSPERIIEPGRQLVGERRVTGFDEQQDPCMIRVFFQAIEVFGKSELAAKWLLQPVRRFEGRTSLEMLGSEEGARRVEEMLVQIDEGIYT